MELYLLKSAACLALFFAFYKLFLENTSIHNFKRFYLSGSLLASFLIPLITFTTYVEASPIIATHTAATPQQIFIETETTVNYWSFVLWTVYGLGVLFFILKFFRNLFSLIQKIKKNPKFRNSSFINILLSENVIPHTFFSYIFLNKTQFENHEIPAEVMLHEEAHARQKHSFDVIFVELLQIVFWFNPLLYFIKKSIKLNHEFLADRAVLSAGAETSEYQKILLAFSSNALTPSLAHSINYSSTRLNGLILKNSFGQVKKRFTVMKTHTSKRAVWLRSLLLLPLLSILIYGFSTKEVVQKDFSNIKTSTNNSIEDIQIRIDRNSKISLNGKTVAFSSLKEEINKLNTSLTIEQKQKYLSATITIEADSQRNLFEKIREILYSSNIRSWSETSLEGEKASGLKHIPWTNPMVGKSIEEAEVLYQENQKKNEQYKKAAQNIKNDKNNPWSIVVGEEVERDENTGKIIQQKATKAEIAEYNKLAIKYNAVDIEKRIIKKKDLERLEIIYRKMTDAQKAKAEPFPECIPPPPPPPPLPSAPKVNKGEKSDIPPPPPPAPKAPSAENGNLYTASQAPPPPNKDLVEYIKELGKRGATFYIGPHKYSTDEAIELVRKNNEATIDVSKYPDVHLGGC
ncbi:M56 family metallopeptidase [Aequorivita sediminis]|uniref:M56 family metallopeptidase n=1 Tax=Aequorivita sediminis TaxID=3073653 RepID=UPI0028B1D3CC|nr:M56 family metallopeptidase [Aequorivita sp. F6058]